MTVREDLDRLIKLRRRRHLLLEMRSELPRFDVFGRLLIDMQINIVDRRIRNIIGV